MVFQLNLFSPKLSIWLTGLGDVISGNILQSTAKQEHRQLHNIPGFVVIQLDLYPI